MNQTNSLSVYTQSSDLQKTAHFCQRIILQEITFTNGGDNIEI